MSQQQQHCGAMAIVATGWNDDEWARLRRGKSVVVDSTADNDVVATPEEEEKNDEETYGGQLEEKVCESDEDEDEDLGETAWEDVVDGEGEGSISDDEEYFSDYSDEGRLEKFYESDEDLDTEEEEEDDDDYDEEDDSEGSSSDDDDVEDCVSDYSREGRLEKGHESNEVAKEEEAAAADGGVVDDVEDVVPAKAAAADGGRDDVPHGSFGDLDDLDSLINNYDDDILERAKTAAYLAGYRHGYSASCNNGYHRARLLRSPLYQPYYMLGVGMYTPAPYPHYMAPPPASPYGGYSSYIPPPPFPPATSSAAAEDWWRSMF